MSLRTGPVRVGVAYAPDSAFVDRTRSILGRLGYPLLTPEEFASKPSSDWPAGAPHFQIADERRIDEVRQVEGAAKTPIIMLTGRHGASMDDARIVAAVHRPAGLHDLYCVLQQIFELTPRCAPRIPVTLSVDCLQQSRQWKAELLSISENGGLLRCHEKVSLGSNFDVKFDLPGCGSVLLRAEAAYQMLPDLGVVFSGMDAITRKRIARFVADEILAA